MKIFSIGHLLAGANKGLTDELLEFERLVNDPDIRSGIIRRDAVVLQNVVRQQSTIEKSSTIIYAHSLIEEMERGVRIRKEMAPEMILKALDPNLDTLKFCERFSGFLLALIDARKTIQDVGVSMNKLMGKLNMNLFKTCQRFNGKLEEIFQKYEDYKDSLDQMKKVLNIQLSLVWRMQVEEAGKRGVRPRDLVLLEIGLSDATVGQAIELLNRIERLIAIERELEGHSSSSDGVGLPWSAV